MVDDCQHRAGGGQSLFTVWGPCAQDGWVENQRQPRHGETWWPGGLRPGIEVLMAPAPASPSPFTPRRQPCPPTSVPYLCFPLHWC